jgi:2,3-bisphosphoglycerate-dependent phosphoglycerate mutase
LTGATRVLAIRHGETAWNADGRIQGHIDIPLNDTGRWQAGRVARALADERIDAIYSSDLARAHQTAEALAHVAGRPVVADAGLRERHFGIFEGRNYHDLERELPEQTARWRRRDPHFGPEGGETLDAFFARVVTSATRHAAAHPGQTVVLVAHGGVLDCLYRAATGLDLQAPRTWQLGNASINRLLYTGERFTLVGWADDGHLAAPAADERSI